MTEAEALRVLKQQTACNACPSYQATSIDPTPKCRAWCDCYGTDRPDPNDPDSEQCLRGLW